MISFDNKLKMPHGYWFTFRKISLISINTYIVILPLQALAWISILSLSLFSLNSSFFPLFKTSWKDKWLKCYLFLIKMIKFSILLKFYIYIFKSQTLSIENWPYPYTKHSLQIIPRVQSPSKAYQWVYKGSAVPRVNPAPSGFSQVSHPTLHWPKACYLPGPSFGQYCQAQINCASPMKPSPTPSIQLHFLPFLAS